jgi:hypothetical protein
MSSTHATGSGRVGLTRFFTLPRRSWERDFTVVQWDHRRAGKTVGRNGKAGSGEMTFYRRGADAVEVVEFPPKTPAPLGCAGPTCSTPTWSPDLYVHMVRNKAPRLWCRGHVGCS